MSLFTNPCLSTRPFASTSGIPATNPCRTTRIQIQATNSCRTTRIQIQARKHESKSKPEQHESKSKPQTPAAQHEPKSKSKPEQHESKSKPETKHESKPETHESKSKPETPGAQHESKSKPQTPGAQHESKPETQAVPPGLSVDYYAKTCPNFERILLEIITPKQTSTPTTAAATLRVFFHDCFVEGCDGSVLINPTPSGNTERDNPLNLDLPGDAFDVIVRIKTALEINCPGVVSCSDILAATTRHLIKQVGGPFYKVMLGKKDGLVSVASHVDHNLTDEKQNFDTMYAPFLKKGFTIREMVALLGGGHTIGFAHCSKFANRIFKFSPTAEIDPTLNPSFAARLRTLCANYTKNENVAAFMDPMSPGKFDNNFYTNVMRGLDLLPSDHMLMSDPRSKPMVEEYAKDQDKFFKDFAEAMEKLNVLGVKTGKDGEIRTNCFAFNS